MWSVNQYNITYKSSNLITNLYDIGNTASVRANYSVSNGTVTVTATSDDGVAITNGRVYLEANKSYTFNCTTNGTWGGNGKDTVEALFLLGGGYTTYYTASTQNYSFTPSVTGTYWLRLDVNTSGKTYTFSDIRIHENIKTIKANYDSNVDLSLKENRSGFTFKGWNTDYKATTGLSSLKVGTSNIILYSIIVDDIIPSVQAFGGSMLYKDPSFSSGINSIKVYNNSGSGTVTHTRKAMPDNPEGSGYGIEIKTTGSAQPGHGGFSFQTPSAANKEYITRIVAKIPVGYTINWNSNECGTTGKVTEWLTPQEGTGAWQEYAFRVRCGSDGSFNTTNYYYLLGGGTATTSAPVTWELGYATVIDTSQKDSNAYIITVGKDSGSKVAGYGLNQDNSNQPAFTEISPNTAIVKISSGLTKNGTYYVWIKDKVGNINKTAVTINNIGPILTTSVSTTAWTNQNVTVTITSDTTNKYADFTPNSTTKDSSGTIITNQGKVEDVSSTESGPITSAKTWKFTKTGSTNQWQGLEGTYNGVFTANANDLIIVSGYYKTSAAAGINTLTMGSIQKAGWAGKYNISVLENANAIVANGQWNYFYCIMKANEAISGGIIVDGPAWGYSTQQGTLYLNGINWRIIPSTNTTARSIHVRKYTKGTQGVDYFKNGGGTYLNGNTVSISENGTYTFYVEDQYGNGTVKTITISNIDKTAPTATSFEIKNITASGYDVYVYGVKDDGSGVNRVQFPTWTDANGQDDIQSSWQTNTAAKGTKQSDGTTWVYRVNATDHKNEYGIYHTHIYVYDNLGNSKAVFSKNDISVPGLKVYFDVNYLASTNLWANYIDINNWTSWATTPTSKGWTAANVQDGKYLYHVMPAGTQGGPVYHNSTGLTSGSTYTWKVVIKSNRTMNMRIGCEQGGLTTVEVSASAWREYSYTFTANNNTTKNNFILYPTDGYKSGDQVYIYALQCAKLNGRSYKTIKTVGYNSTIGTLPTATKTGHTFLGWYTEKVYGSAITASQKITNNVTYYAHWAPYAHTIAYSANGGTGAPGNQTKYYGGDLYISNTKPTKSYSVFQNWNTKADGTGTTYTSGQRYTADQNGGTVTLYARYRQQYAYVTGIIDGNVLYINSTPAAGNVIGRLHNNDQVWIHGESGDWWYVYAHSRIYDSDAYDTWVYGWVYKGYITTPQ